MCANAVSNSFIKWTWWKMRFPKKGAYRGSQCTVMLDNFIETMKLYMMLWGLLSLTWSHCITNTFIAALFDFGRTTIDVCLITWLLFDLKHEVKHLLEIETELRCSWSELEFGIYTDGAAAIQFWSIKLFSWSASQTKQGAMLLWYYCVSLQTFVVQLYINRETWCTS